MGRCAVAAVLVAVAVGQGALADDELMYRLGGGEPISLGPSARASALRLGVGAGWNANLTCGNFDMGLSISQQLNGITGAFQNVMGNIMQTAQGVVASLPALVIQRLNPGLYDLLQNGVLEAGQEFRMAKLRCDEITDSMGETLGHEGWSGVARADYWREQAALGGRDVLEVADEVDTTGADDGVQWIGGNRAGGAGQDEIEVVGDVSTAGYNLLLGRGAADDSAVAAAACGDSDICRIWEDPDELVQWAHRVLGEVEIRTCDGCQKVQSEAGLGLASVYRREKTEIVNLLQPIVQIDGPITQATLDGLSGGAGFRITRQLIEAIREERRPVELANRLAGEVAVGRAMEQASMARRALEAGMREPHVANNEVALERAQRVLDQLDREIRQLELELRVKTLVASNSAVRLFERRNIRKRVPVFEVEPQGRLEEGAPR